MSVAHAQFGSFYTYEYMYSEFNISRHQGALVHQQLPLEAGDRHFWQVINSSSSASVNVFAAALIALVLSHASAKAPQLLAVGQLIGCLIWHTVPGTG